MNLFTVAAANAASLEQRFHNIKSTLPSKELDELNRFIEWVERERHVAINMRQTVLLSFLTLGNYQNIYEWARSHSSISLLPIDHILREALKAFYERRLVFDAYFEHGKEFRYGVLITSGSGATDYGNYCSVLKEQVFTHIELAYLRADSLATYMLTGPTVDATAVQEDAALHSHSHFLAGIKHFGTVPHVPESSWPSLLCSSEDFIEAIFTGRIGVDDLEEIRMLKSDYDLFFHYAFEDFREKLDEADRCLVEGFAFILKLLKQHGIRLELI